MAKKGFRAITVPTKTFDKLSAYKKYYNMSWNEMATKRFNEMEEYQKFADKITKVPESVRKYI